MSEKRSGKRFEVGWPIKVESKDDDGLNEEGSLRNISSGGALFSLSKPLVAGTRLEISIKLPSKKENWMKYSAHVLRIENNGAGFMAAVKFEGAKPQFGM